MENINMNNYPIRAYGRTQLAQIYFPEMTPDAAYRKLKSWIEGCTELKKALGRLGYGSRQRMYTPAQVAAIFDLLGEP